MEMVSCAMGLLFHPSESARPRPSIAHIADPRVGGQLRSPGSTQDVTFLTKALPHLAKRVRVSGGGHFSVPSCNPLPTSTHFESAGFPAR